MYQEMRIGLHEDVMAAKDKILELSKDFHNIFGRLPFGLIETYKLDDAEIVYIAMGSVFGTLRDAIDELRQEGIRAGALKICCFRPFPGEEILKIMRGILAHTPDLPPRIIVIDRSISLGSGGILANEIKAAF